MRMLALLAAAVLMAAAVAQEKTLTQPIAEPTKKVKELQMERIATLRDAAEISMKLARSARVEVEEALDDQLALLKAELEAAEKGSERITLLQRTLDSLKQYEELAKVRKENARGTHLTILRVKARRLKVEMELEQEKANGSK